MANVAKRLEISGRVQGVGYRQAFAERACALGLRGWVANRRDGSVEAIVAGDAAAVGELVAWSRRGPSAARVTEVRDTPAEGDFDRFEIAATR